jgi:hypothetical protein
MKYATVLALLAASAVQGYIIPPSTHKVDWRHEEKRQIIASMTQMTGMIVRIEKRKHQADCWQAREEGSRTLKGRLVEEWHSHPTSSLYLEFVVLS